MAEQNALCSFRATGSRKCRYGDRRGGTTYLSDCWRFDLATRPSEIIFMERLGQQERLNNKRSIEINGHRTGVSLEDAFWNALKEIAATRHVSVSDLITTINKERQHTNLSSVLRLFVLDHYRAQVDARKLAERPIDEKGRSAHRAAPHYQ
jgi:predicted DNA-binding ribbon-helix-helix protein